MIGSNAGNTRTPAWALNLGANPAAEVEVRADRRPVTARVPVARSASSSWNRDRPDRRQTGVARLGGRAIRSQSHRSMQRRDSPQSGRRSADRLNGSLDGPSKTITVEPIKLPSARASAPHRAARPRA